MTGTLSGCLTASILASGTELGRPDDYAAIGPGGNIYLTDDEYNGIRRITPAGGISIFLSEGDLIAVNQLAAAEMEGDIAFDAEGNLYVTDDTGHHILRFDTGLAGSIFVTAGEMSAVTGVVPDINGGVAFVP